MTDPVFFVPSRRYSAIEVANLTGATLTDPGHAETEIKGIASAMRRRRRRCWSIVEGRRNADLAGSLSAAAVLCSPDIADKMPAGIAVLVTARPQLAFATIGRLLFPAAASPHALTGETGISPRAHVDPTARLEQGVIVEAGAVVGTERGHRRGNDRRAQRRHRSLLPDRPRLLYRTVGVHPVSR